MIPTLPRRALAAILALTVMSAGSAAATPAARPDTAASHAGATLRSTLNTLLQEHIYLAAGATGAALAGRDAEFKAAAGALDANSVELSTAIGSVYGDGAGEAFLELWRKHIGLVVDYTVGVARNDRAMQEAAVAELVDYTTDFGAFLAAANPHLPAPAVTDLVKTHVLTLKHVIDAQAKGDQAEAWMAAREAAQHMAMIANPLADAIMKQFPGKFGE
jgi:hypothetical protein